MDIVRTLNKRVWWHIPSAEACKENSQNIAFQLIATCLRSARIDIRNYAQQAVRIMTCVASTCPSTLTSGQTDGLMKRNTDSSAYKDLKYTIPMISLGTAIFCCKCWCYRRTYIVNSKFTNGVPAIFLESSWKIYKPETHCFLSFEKLQIIEQSSTNSKMFKMLVAP